MNNRYSRGIRTAAVVAVVIAAALVCTAAGTLAAFSATYTWSSDTASGDFPFSDADYTLELFDGASAIMPGDGGSAVLEGPSFDGYDVAWTFSETNASVLPVVFFVRDAEGARIAGAAYSVYDFSALNGTYVETETAGERLPLTDVSADPAAFTAALSVGATVCWVWPDAFYADGTGDALSKLAAVDAYNAYCRRLCTRYTFDPALADVLNGHALAFVTGGSGEALTWKGGENGTAVSVSDGFVYVGGSAASVYSSEVFSEAETFATSGLPADAEVWLLVLSSSLDTITANAQGAGVDDFIVNAGSYAVDSSHFTATPDSDGIRTLLKIKVAPSAGGGHPLSVEITATVTAA